MATYSELLRAPGLARIIATQLLARFPFGMMSLGFVMHIQHVYQSYTIAGIALGAETIGAAISGPVLGRNLGRFGTRPLIGVSTVITALAIFGIAMVDFSSLLTIFLSLIVGLTSPPIQSATRTIYPKLVKKRQLNSLFSLDATLQELIWVIGPVLATVLAAQISTAAVVVTMGALSVIGSTLFLINKEVGEVEIPVASRRIGGVLKSKVVLANVVLGLLLVGSFSGVEVGTVGLLDKGTAGLVIASLSVGSIVGGLVLGKRTGSRWSFSIFSSIIVLGYALAYIAPTNAVWLGICWFIAGLGIAPSLGWLGATISANLKMSETAEAFGWVNTGQLMGYSAGAALAGVTIDTISATAAFMIAIVFGVGTLAVALLTVNIHPVLSKNHPETGPIQTIAPDEKAGA